MWTGVGYVVVVGPDLCRVELPCPNRKRLGEEFAVEFGSLVDRWESGRGTDWHTRNAEPLRQLELRNADLARRAGTAVRRGNAAAAGILAAVVASFADMTVIISTAESDFADTEFFGMLLWPGFLVVPTAAFLLVFLPIRARDRARSRG